MSGHCADCGEQLDQFGICPFADPGLARISHAPVNCGRTALENGRRLRLLVERGAGPARGAAARGGR